MAHAVEEEPVLHMGVPVNHGKLAIWIFLATEIMFFTGLIGVYIILRNGTPTDKEPWPRPEDVHLREWIGAVNTFVLICSSLTVVLAHYALAKGKLGRAVQYVAVTLLLGTVFLGGTAFEWHDLIYRQQLTISRNLFGTTYFTLVGLHAVHVTGGVTIMLIVLVLALGRRLTGAKEGAAVGLVSWYWHFVDVIWVVVFTVVYLVGR